MEKNYLWEFEGFNIYDWLDENESNFKYGNTANEYAENALSYFKSDENIDSLFLIKHELAALSPDLDNNLYSIAQAKFLLEQKFSKSFMYALFCIFLYSEDERLLSMRDLYAIYGKPAYKSPQKVVSDPKFKDLIGNEVREQNYRIEDVIQYGTTDIMANHIIVTRYLELLDPENFVRFKECLRYYTSGNIIEFLFEFIFLERI